MDFIDYIKEGQKGFNKGVSFNNPFDVKLPQGICKSKYYLIGAASGHGKTTFTDEQFLFNPFLQNQDVKWIYFSFEISKVDKQASALSYFINFYEGKEISPSRIKGEEHPLLNDAELELIERYVPKVNELFSKIMFYEDSLTYSQIDTILNNCVSDIQTIVIIDHIALLDDQNKPVKLCMDALSKVFVKHKNKNNYTIVVVQQFNSELETYYRSANKDPKSLIPSKQDFGDSKYTYRDADVVIGGVMPAALLTPNYLGYEITKIKESSFWHILKNRNGPLRGYVAYIRKTSVPKLELLPDSKIIRYIDYK